MKIKHKTQLYDEFDLASFGQRELIELVLDLQEQLPKDIKWLELQEMDLKNPITLGEHYTGIKQAVGRITPELIGRRFYINNGVYQMENKEQYNRRISHE